MVVDQVVSTASVSWLGVRNGRWRRPLVVSASLAAMVAFLGWIAMLALTLPSRYLVNHWDVAWVGFDVMLLISLLTTGWAAARRLSWASLALMVSATMLVCDAWFDVTTASGSATTLVSIGVAAGVALPAAAGLAWAAAHVSNGRRARLIETQPPQPATQGRRSRERVVSMTEHRVTTGPSTEGYPTTSARDSDSPAVAMAAPAGGATHVNSPPPTYWPPPPTHWPPQPPQAPVPPHRPPRGRRAAWLIAALAAGLVLMLVIAAGAFLAGGAGRPSAQPQPSVGGAGMSSHAPAAAGPGVSSAQISSVATKVDPGIVDVNTVLGYQNGAAAGTGIVLSADGLVLTNNHVVAGATSISVTDIGNGQTYLAIVIGYDRTQDIAVLKLSGASALTIAPLGDSSTLGTGASVVAIGNAGGAGGTPNAVGGTVTALNQSITAQDDSTGASEQLTGLIEVNAAIQPGDSGGPLATISGQVIGINTAASASLRRRAASRDAYAIPINQATTTAKQIEVGRASTTVHIGASAFLGIQTGTQTGNRATGGVLVLGVLSGSPAQAAGLSNGDVIESVNGQSIDSPTTLTRLLDQYHPGDHLGVGWTDATGRAHTGTVIATTGPVG